MHQGFRLIALAAVATAPSLLGAEVQAPLAGNTGLAINNSGRIEVLSATPIDFRNLTVANGRRHVRLRTNAIVLCADFFPTPGAGVNPVGLELIDPNGDSVASMQPASVPPAGPGAASLLFGGINDYSYFTNGGNPSLLTVSSDTQLGCCVRLGQGNAACVQGPNGGENLPGVFEDGFEALVQAQPDSVLGGGPANLAVTLTGAATATPGSSYGYTVTVTNLGGAIAENVRVRDWYPKTTGGFPAFLGAGSVSCSAGPGAICGSVPASGNLLANGVSLVPGAAVQFTVSRPLNPGAPESQAFTVAAAAFAPPSAGETVLLNNQASRQVTVQTNAPPTLDPIGNPPAFDEDGSSVQLALTANDPDSVLTPASFSCAGNPNVIDASSCQFGGSEPNFTLVVSPRAHANTQAAFGANPGQITVTVSDGTLSANRQFTIVVNPVNDPPEFTLLGNRQHNAGTSGLINVSNFVTAIRPGPASALDEQSQGFLERSLLVLDDGDDILCPPPSTPTMEFEGTFPNETGRLLYCLNGQSGTVTLRVRMRDSGGTANGGIDTADQTFTITVLPPN